MSDVVYRSEVRIERVKGPVRKAYLPAEAEPVIFGVHGAVAEHYKVQPSIPGQDGVRLGDAGNLSERFAPQPLPNLGQGGSLGIAQPQRRS